MAISGKGLNIGMSELLERQMHNWEQARKPETSAQAETVGPEELKFYVAISRECGCDGEKTADALAEKTGFQKFDSEILDYMAGNDTIRRRLYDTLDDRTMGWIESICSSLAMGPAASGVEYFNRLTRELLAICHNTHAVILGRAANFILPRESGLAVRLVAPRDYRLKNFAERTKQDLKSSLENMERIDAGRGKFVESHFGKFAFDPRRYDLTINVSQFSLDEVVEMILLGLKSKAGKSLKLPVKQAGMKQL